MDLGGGGLLAVADDDKPSKHRDQPATAAGACDWAGYVVRGSEACPTWLCSCELIRPPRARMKCERGRAAIISHHNLLSASRTPHTHALSPPPTMNRTGGGDDLDDDFVPDDLVALSDVEDEDAAHSADGEDIAALLSADEGEAAQASGSQVAAEKKRKRRAKEKERKAKVRRL